MITRVGNHDIDRTSFFPFNMKTNALCLASQFKFFNAFFCMLLGFANMKITKIFGIIAAADGYRTNIF